MLKQLTIDTCPVCGLYSAVGHKFCGTRCRHKAHDFRKRLMLVKRFLRSAGFTVSWDSNGVQMTTELPKSLWYAYPPGLQRFVFPDSPTSIVVLNASDYWHCFDNQWGKPFRSFVEWQFSAGHPSEWLIGELEIFVRAIVFDKRYMFRCSVCDKEYIKSPEGVLLGLSYRAVRDGSEKGDSVGICSGCANKGQPF